MKGDKVCPECRGGAYIDTWHPPLGLDKRWRKFLCSDCGTEFLVLVKDVKERAHLDRLVARR